MDSHYQNQLEKAIGDALKRLPDREAPPELVCKVMRRIHDRSTQRSNAWDTWSVSAKTLTMAVLLMVFGAVCFAGLKISHYSHVPKGLVAEMDGITTIVTMWNALTTVVHAVFAAYSQLGTLFILGCIVAVALAYGIFIAVGTLYLRVALAHR